MSAPCVVNYPLLSLLRLERDANLKMADFLLESAPFQYNTINTVQYKTVQIYLQSEG